MGVRDGMDGRSGGRVQRYAVFPLAAAMLLAHAVPAEAQAARAAEGRARGPAGDVEARELAFASTMADRDLDAFLTFVSPEAIFFNGDQPLRGRAAVTEAWSAFFEGEQAPFSWRPDVVEVLESGSLALSSGPVFDPDGQQIGRFNSIWRKDADGQWRVVFDRGS
jgi:ketosteroid isomerase-like protein